MAPKAAKKGKAAKVVEEVVEEEPEQVWGRVLIAGGTDWAMNGKQRKSQLQYASDLIAPTVMRSLCHLKIVKVISGCSANYGIAIDSYGVAHLFGKLPAMALDPKGIVDIMETIRISPRALSTDQTMRFIDGAAGRAHFFLLDNKGGVWGAGMNTIGQLGLPTSSDTVPLTKIEGPWGRDKIVQVTAGLTFSLFLSEKGEVFACGSCEHGQLGNGVTGERIVKGNKTAFDAQTPARRVLGDLEGKKIVQIASGNQHSIALDEDGFVYVWGYAGYARLGLGDDQADKLFPTEVLEWHYTQPVRRGRTVLCGPTSSVVIDGQGNFHIAGKWKNTGDGKCSGGAPFRTYKPVGDIYGCRVHKAALGGCTHFITTFLDPPANTKVQTAGWGQGAAYGELGFGIADRRSSTIPLPIKTFSEHNINVLDIAAGQFFTLFLVEPSASLGQLERFPYEVNPETLCLVCHTDRSTEAAMECERCDAAYHPSCLTPPLDGTPEDAWYCPDCEADANKTLEAELFSNIQHEDVAPSTPAASTSAPKRPANSQGSATKKQRTK